MMDCVFEGAGLQLIGIINDDHGGLVVVVVLEFWHRHHSVCDAFNLSNSEGENRFFYRLNALRRGAGYGVPLA